MHRLNLASGLLEERLDCSENGLRLFKGAFLYVFNMKLSPWQSPCCFPKTVVSPVRDSQLSLKYIN